jgi:hypothetical protein
MREHQIVITLKPEQFLEVQRLARQANAKSMGIFVRQKLLQSLGIEGGKTDKTNSNNDIKIVVQELKQLHSELKSFVAQSLSMYNNQNLPLPQNPTHQPTIDDLEELAEKTFAISPRLGPIENTTRDPLHELLGSEEFPPATNSNDDDEDEYDEGEYDQGEDDNEISVPLAIQQRREELAQKDNSNTKSTSSDISSDTKIPSDTTSSSDTNSSASALDESEIISPDQTKSENSHDNKGSNTNFSGGPPPKKRHS